MMVGRSLRDAVLGGDLSNLDTTTQKVAELKERLSELEKIYPLDSKTELNAFVDTVEAWEVEAEKIVSVARNNTAESRTEAAGLIASACSPRLKDAAEKGDALAATLQAAQNNIIARQEMTSNIAIGIILAAMVIATAAVLRIALIIIKSIVVPAEQVHVALSGFSEGKLDIPVDYHSTSELGEMCDALRTSQHVLGECISDTCRLLEEMGNGNFDVRTKDEKVYVGALSSILTSVRPLTAILPMPCPRSTRAPSRCPQAPSRCPPAPSPWPRALPSRPAPWRSCPPLSLRLPTTPARTRKTVSRPCLTPMTPAAA